MSAPVMSQYAGIEAIKNGYDDVLMMKDIRSFSDWQQIEPWAAEAVQATTGFGLMQGMDDGTFAPLSGTTRAQAAVVLCRLLDLLEREV